MRGRVIKGPAIVNHVQAVQAQDAQPMAPPLPEGAEGGNVQNNLNEHGDGDDLKHLLEDIFNSGTSVIERVESAIIILKTVNIGMIHEGLKVRLTVPLFMNTNLAREHAVPTTAAHGAVPEDVRPGTSAQAKGQAKAQNAAPAPAIVAYTEDQVVRKNIYYLASILHNFSQVLIQLIQFGVLRLEDKDQIIDEKACKGDLVLKGLLLYSKLIRVNLQQYGTLIRVLRDTGNKESADLLELKNIPPAAIRVAVGIVPAGQDAAAAATPAARRQRGRRSSALVQLAFPNLANQALEVNIEEEPGTWACPTCTYRNIAALNVCEICEMPNNYRIDEDAQYDYDLPPRQELHCRYCTYLNEPNFVECVMCGHYVNVV